MFPHNRRYPLGALREVLDALPSAIVVFDESGAVRFANRTAESLVAKRCSTGEIRDARSLFLTLGPMCSPDGGALEPGELPQHLLERGEPFEAYELRASERWGGAYPVLRFSGRRVRDDAGGESLRVLTIEDVSHQHESERLFRTAFERGPVPVTLVRSSDQCVLDANSAFLKLLGYGRDQVVGQTVPELAIVLNDDEMSDVHTRLERGEDVERLELVVRGGDGTPRTMLSWHRWVEVGGEDCLLGVYVDITEQKELERRLQEATRVVLQSASIFSRSVVQQLERLGAPDRAEDVSGELDLLTRREREVVIRVGAGLSNLRIAEELSLTPQTVRNYVTRIYRKTGVTNRSEAVVWARERGLVQE